MTLEFRLITYDLLADGFGGRSVNDANSPEVLIELEYDERGITTEEDSSTLDKLGLSADEAEIQEVSKYCIYLNDKQGDPLCELRAEEN